MATPVLRSLASFLCLFALAGTTAALAQSLLAPGDLRLRNDLELLNDSAAVGITLTSWPVSQADIDRLLETIDADFLTQSTAAAYERLRTDYSSAASKRMPHLVVGFAGAIEPIALRTFEDTPRDEGAVNVHLSWQGERVAVNLAAAYHANPFDDDHLRPDGTHVAILLGNWIVSAGWQDRWFGPGRDGSLILAGNARPAPGIMLQRSTSRPFRSRWLTWLGPWSFTTFMSQLDDERTIDDTWLFGVRGSFRPASGLEIGISRTAQWCGDGRPCSLSTFGDLIVGNDNRGVNVSAADEPGNQLGGFDIRWVMPGNIPAAAYLQWIGEDGRGGGGAIGSWMRQVGLEHWGSTSGLDYRIHVEVSDSMCKEGGLGFSSDKPDCAYEHSIYRTGYRYEGRALGHFADSDSLSYSIGSTLVQSAGHTWNATLRYMEINRQGLPNPGHTLSAAPQKRSQISLSHRRATMIGQLYLGLGYRRVEDVVSSVTGSDVTAFLQWNSK